jgi:HK97 family phage prohead protease
MNRPKIDLARFHRSTFGPDEPLSDFAAHRESLELVARLRRAARNVGKTKTKTHGVGVRRRSVSSVTLTPPPPASRGWHYSALNRSVPMAAPPARHATEHRALSDGGVRLYGYAALWNRLSVPLGNFREKISPGAFAKTLSEVRAGNHTVLAYLEHDHRLLLGRTGVNLELREDDKGLRFELTLPATSVANDAAELVRRRLLSGMSFGFVNAVDSWARGNGDPIRTVRDLLLLEVSIVGSPAYPSTSIQSSRSALNDLAWKSVHLRALSNRASKAEMAGWTAERARPDPKGIERR